MQPAEIAALFRLNKDRILQKFGPPRKVFYGDQTYTLENLPETYFLSYADVSFCVRQGAVIGITLLSPRGVLDNGLRVGDSEEKVKQVCGRDYVLRETEFKDFLIYQTLGLSFEINKKNRSVLEINIESKYGARM